MREPAPAKPHFAYIDCLRGYAVLLVIASHLTELFPELPYPVKRLAASGWFGVQLFFLASSLTLLMSWHSERQRDGRVSLRAFALRRFFRIAPAYYAAAVLYCVLRPPALGFDFWQALRTVLFVHSWHPAWIAVPEAWYVVPGGWSISVEFAFYAVFPIFAVLVTSLGRAWLAVLVCLGIGTAANLVAGRFFAGAYHPEQISNFLFFWFPNQLSVFALGGILFFTLRDCPRLMERIGRHSTALGLGAIGLFCLLPYLPPLSQHLGARPWLPAAQAACLPMLLLVLALSRHHGWLVSRPLQAIGQVSFSVYLLHFAVLQGFTLLPEVFQLRATGVRAIAAYGIGFLVCAGATFLLACLSYRFIEQPGVALGKRLIARLRPPAAALA